jgi:hypothetical protein
MQSSVHLLYDLLARVSMTVKITFTCYEKYVHVTVMYLLEKEGFEHSVREETALPI